MLTKLLLGDASKSAGRSQGCCQGAWLKWWNLWYIPCVASFFAQSQGIISSAA
ncbi:MAG: hypothetical protein WCL42_07615 [Chlorobiaceae bacterium]